MTSEGDISNYYPDFLVKLADGRVVVVETKGLEDVDVSPKLQRLKQWCADVNAQKKDTNYDFVYVDEESFNRYKPKSFSDLLSGFRQYKT